MLANQGYRYMNQEFFFASEPGIHVFSEDFTLFQIFLKTSKILENIKLTILNFELIFYAPFMLIGLGTL